MNIRTSTSPMRMLGNPVKARVVLPFCPAQERIRDLVCYEHQGVLLYEGDVIVRRAASVLNVVPRAAIGRLGHIIRDPGERWPEGIIPVDVPSSMQSLVGAAIAAWESATPLRFPGVTQQTDYVTFATAGRNASSVGRTTGPQLIYLDETADLRTAIHEIGHAVGLYHEHSRPDAGQYIELHRDNMETGAEAHFSQPVSSEIHGDYDYDSVMHYDPYAFSRNGQPTITTRNGADIGHLSQLSAGDIATCKSLYAELQWS